MIGKVYSFIKQHHMIERGDHILAGVSGGADSVCLLLVLKELSQRLGCTLTAVHVEHGIRGAESLSDMRFVEGLCETQKIPCLVCRCDAPGFARARGMSLEEGARALRYGFFRQAAEQTGANRIAVAHNREDCGETLLFHLARGTGLRGLCGIAPVRGAVIRPLLGTGRKEIEAYLAEKEQMFCTDRTNQETAYSRNKIRHQILPLLTEINEGAADHLYQSAERIREAAELVEGLAEEAAKRRVSGWLLMDSLCEEPPLIQKNVVLSLLGECAGSRKDLTAIHVEKVLELFTKQTGRQVSLPYGMEAFRTYKGVQLRRKEGAARTEADGGACPGEAGEGPLFDLEEALNGAVSFQPGSSLRFGGGSWHISCRILEKKEEFQKIPQKKYTKWFDYDKIKDTLLIRKRSPGDYFLLEDGGGRQKLKNFFINEKIPKEFRERIPLLTNGTHVLWIIGYRISGAYKITEDTERVLEVQVNGGCIHE